MSKEVFICILMQYFLLTFSQRKPNDNFFQSDYEVIPEYINIDWINKSFVESHKLIIRKFNRTTIALSGAVKTKITVSQLYIKVKAYKFLSGDFKFTGVEKLVEFCNVLKNSYYGSEILKTKGNFTNCPCKPGHYGIANVIVDSSRFPPLIPAGRYKLISEIFTDPKKPRFALATSIGTVVTNSKLSRKRPASYLNSN